MAGRPTSRIETLAASIITSTPPELAARMSAPDVDRVLGCGIGTADSVRRLVAGYALAHGFSGNMAAHTADKCRATFAALGAAAPVCTAGDVRRLHPETPEAVSNHIAALVRGMGMANAPRPQERTHSPVAAPSVAPAPSDEPQVLLVVGDAHAAPGASLARFVALGRLTADLAPDAVVQIGDFYDLPSLSTYDKGRATAEGRRFTDDMRAGDVALDLWHEHAAGALDRADRLFTEGNHEERGARFVNDNPALIGTLAEPVASFQQRGWRVTRFLEAGEIAGFFASHYWHPKGNTKSGIGGTVYPARALRLALNANNLSGHTHAMSWEQWRPPIGKPIHSLVTGCFDDASHGWAKRDNARYAVGVNVLRRYAEGWTHEWIPMPVVLDRYGRPGDDKHRV